MKPDQFQELALKLPETELGSHQGHPDFRVGGKIFATIGPDGDWGMVKLTPDMQSKLIRELPDAFEMIKGAWGKRGCTRVVFAKARVPKVREALTAAWLNVAPKRIASKLKGN